MSIYEKSLCEACGKSAVGWNVSQLDKQTFWMNHAEVDLLR